RRSKLRSPALVGPDSSGHAVGRRVRLPPPSPPGGQRSAAHAGGLETTPPARTGAALALFGVTRAPTPLARRSPRPDRCPFRLRAWWGLWPCDVGTASLLFRYRRTIVSHACSG